MMSKGTGLLLSVTALTSCGPSAQQVDFDLSKYALVDLTHAFTPETLYWPTSPSGFRLDELAYGPTPGGWFYSSYAFAAPEHGGTHLDAPIHFHEGGRTTDQIPLEQLVTKAVVIDLSARAAQDRDARLSLEDIAAFEAEHGRIPAGAFVLLKTGWDRYWGDRMAYFGDTTPGDASKLHFPGYGAEAAKLLVEDRQVTGLGVDSPSIDYGPSADFEVHRILSARNGIALENLTGLSGLPPVGATVIALPMKIAKGSGGPVRVIGLVLRSSP